MTILYRYHGRGVGAYLPDLPARDLTPEDVARLGRERIEASGLYSVVVEKPAPVAHKRAAGPSENKSAVGDEA